MGLLRQAEQKVNYPTDWKERFRDELIRLETEAWRQSEAARLHASEIYHARRANEFYTIQQALDQCDDPGFLYQWIDETAKTDDDPIRHARRMAHGYLHYVREIAA